MIVDLLFIPAVVMILGAFILPLLPEKTRSSAFLVFPLIALVSLWQYPNDFAMTLAFGNYELVPVAVDSLSRVFGIAFALVAIIGGVYALHLKDVGQQSSALVYAGGALGVTFAGDYFTFLVFWELMAVSSVYLIWARKTEETDRAGMRYLLMHMFGGGLLMAGILWHVSDTGSLLIESLPYEFTYPSVLMLLGIAVNAAVPPLHAWLSDAYPKATITGAIFMCAITTKSAVYVLIRLFPEWSVLIWVGVMMGIYGTIFALITNDIRQILSYSIISQIGYMVAGTGIGSEIALNAATAHAVNNVLFKSLLFMGAGAVIYATGRSKLTELGGLASKMKAVVALYIVGGLAVSGAPLFNGFTSKTMVIEAAGEAHLEWVMLLLTIASIGSFLHSGLRLPYFTWFSEAKEEITDLKPIPKNMIAGMGIGAFFCILIGVYPDLLYNQLPYPVEFQPYSVYTLVEMVQILTFAFIGFWLFRSKFAGTDKILLDTDWFYRKARPLTERLLVTDIDKFYGYAEDATLWMARFLTRQFRDPLVWLNPFTDTQQESAKYSHAVEVVMSFILLSFIIFAVVYFI